MSCWMLDDVRIDMELVKKGAEVIKGIEELIKLIQVNAIEKVEWRW